MAWILCLDTFILVIAMLHIPINCHDPPDPRKEKLSVGLNSVYDTDESSTRNIVVDFVQKPSTVLNMFDMTGFGLMSENTQANLHKSFIGQMKAMRDESQSDVLRFLEGEAPNRVQSSWITNRIFVERASKELAEALGSFSNVESISEEQVYHIHHPIDGGEIVDESKEVKVQAGTKEVQWNIDQIQAPAMWGQGFTGQGCRVGVIDTGINAQHECFKNTDIKFFDPVNGKTEAYDDNGHGTHVCGTIAGKNGIGVAPGSSLLVCKACDKAGGCETKKLTKCCEIMAEQRPHCVSNSWGGPSDFGKTSQYREVINSWNALGMLALFSAGNSGPSCGTVGSPADYQNVLSVGATNKSEGLAGFSSRGQCKSGAVAPSVSAPGHQIQSAWIGGSTKYNTISGTSMACPHVTGMFALMKSASPQITVDQARTAIIKSCQQRNLLNTPQTCGGTSVEDHPNNMYGNGRIDCLQGVKVARTFEQRNKNMMFELQSVNSVQNVNKTA